MLLYSWKRVRRFAGSSSNRIVLAITSMVRKPRSIYDPLYRACQKDFSGSCYLLNAGGLLNSRASNKQKAEYIGLASYRNLSQYKVTGQHHLNIAMSPLSKQTIEKNKLLQVIDQNIYFKLEDYKGKIYDKIEF